LGNGPTIWDVKNAENGKAVKLWRKMPQKGGTGQKSMKLIKHELDHFVNEKNRRKGKETRVA